MRRYVAAVLAAVVALAPLAGAAPAPAVRASPAGQPFTAANTGPVQIIFGASLPLAPTAPIPPDQLQALVDGVVRQAMVGNHIAGVEVAVVQDGQVLLDRGYGFAGPNRPVDPDRTLFRIGSISKTFTWIMALKEVEAGRMRLDAPINTYL